MQDGQRQEERRGPAAAMLHADVPAEWNALSVRVIGLAIEVHSVLGPGLLERMYEEAMVFELKAAGIPFERQKIVHVKYKGIDLGEQRFDLVVDGVLVLELKSTESVSDVFLATLVSYLRAANLPLGLLINFNVPLLKNGLYRRMNSQAIPKRSPEHTHS